MGGPLGHWEPGWFPPQSGLLPMCHIMTVGAAAGATVEFAADGSLLEWLGLCRLDGGAGEGVGLAKGGRGG